MDKYLDNHYAAILDQIKTAMDKNEVTQKMLGDVLGINQSSVSSLLKGSTQISLTQYLKIAKALGLNSQKLLSDAENSLVQEVPMPENIERTIYKSPVHLLAYCASTLPIKPEEVAKGDITKQQAQTALEDLKRNEVLKESHGKYVQSALTKKMVAKSRLKSSEAHRKVLDHSWKLWNSHIENDKYRQRRFNFYLLERFSTSQIKELEVLSWHVYNKAIEFQNENMAQNYDTKNDDLPLWNIHVMLMTPLE